MRARAPPGQSGGRAWRQVLLATLEREWLLMKRNRCRKGPLHSIVKPSV